MQHSNTNGAVSAVTLMRIELRGAFAVLLNEKGEGSSDSEMGYVERTLGFRTRDLDDRDLILRFHLTELVSILLLFSMSLTRLQLSCYLKILGELTECGLWFAHLVSAVRLMRIELGGAFANLLNEKGKSSGDNEMGYVERTLGFRTSDLDDRDLRLVTYIVGGTIRWRRYLDYLILQLCNDERTFGGMEPLMLQLGFLCLNWGSSHLRGFGSILPQYFEGLTLLSDSCYGFSDSLYLLDHQENDSLPLPKLEGDDRAQACVLATLYSHPVGPHKLSPNLDDFVHMKTGMQVQIQSRCFKQLSYSILRTIRPSTKKQNLFYLEQTCGGIEDWKIWKNLKFYKMNSSMLVNPSGVLVYSTCSIDPEENEERVAAFLLRRPPVKHSLDGVFAARLVRS
ncbi:hypothetical protein LguiB_026898 [Lonicera macranthoides]